jgi:hypothetical protein
MSLKTKDRHEKLGAEARMSMKANGLAGVSENVIEKKGC